MPTPKFGGVIKRNAIDSKPWWAPRIVPPKGAPNILLIMTDDAGFGAPSTFGGVIPTPALDRFAKEGLRYTNFHSTSRLGVIPQDAKLTPWPDKLLRRWDTPEDKKLFIRQADIYAAYLAYTDHEIGRVIDAIQKMGKLDNTPEDEKKLMSAEWSARDDQ